MISETAQKIVRDEEIVSRLYGFKQTYAEKKKDLKKKLKEEVNI